MRDHAAQQGDGFTFRHAANDQRSVAIMGNQVIDIHTKINSLTPYASAHVWRPACRLCSVKNQRDQSSMG
jgi:hypothetical protein